MTGNQKDNTPSRCKAVSNEEGFLSQMDEATTHGATTYIKKI